MRESNLRTQSKETLHQLVNTDVPHYVQNQLNQLPIMTLNTLPTQNNSLNEFDQPYAVISDLEELKNNISRELHEIKVELEEIMFAEPKPMVLENSIQDQVNNLIEKKIELLQNILEQRINFLEDKLKNLENILELLNKNESNDLNEKLNDFKTYVDRLFNRMAINHDNDITELKHRLSLLENNEIQINKDSIRNNTIDYKSQSDKNLDELLKLISTLQIIPSNPYINTQSQDYSNLKITRPLSSNHSRKPFQSKRYNVQPFRTQWIKIFIPKNWTQNAKNQYIQNEIEQLRWRGYVVRF